MAKHSTSSAARRIVQDGSDVRSRMHDLVSAALADGRLDLKAAREAARGVADAMKDTLPADKSNVLRQVFDGMTEAVTGGAHAAKLALDHAAASGKQISSHEVKRLSHTLNTLEHEFLDAVRSAGDKMSKGAGDEWKNMVDRAKRAGTTIRPAAGEALDAATKHAPTLALETVKAGARAARTLTSELAMGLSGVLSGVGDAIRGKKKATKRSAKKRAASKATKKARRSSKPARKPARKATKKARR